MALEHGHHNVVKLTDTFTLKVGNLFRENAFEKAKADPNCLVQGIIIVADDRKDEESFCADVVHLSVGVDHEGRISALHYG
jgi:hypothetical protein